MSHILHHEIGHINTWGMASSPVPFGGVKHVKDSSFLLIIRAFQVFTPGPWTPGSGSQGFIPNFSSFVNFSSLGKRVKLCASGSSSEPRDVLGPRPGHPATFCEFSRILECFDSTYRFALRQNPKKCRFDRFQVGWGYGMVL